jgi:hypothetical protein
VQGASRDNSIETYLARGVDMRTGGSSKRFVLTAVLCAGVLIPSSAMGATTRACRPVVNPYPGTRYEGVDLSRIRATGVSCHTARRVARGAHRKALALTPPPSGVRHFTWNGWQVTGDLRGSSDSYVAKRADERVRWRF